VNNMKKTTAVVGLAGQDELLVANAGITRGGKVPVQRMDTLGYFGLNLAVHLTAQDIPTTLVTVLGSDAVGEKIAAFVRELGIRLHATCIPGRPTPSSHILVQDGERTVFRTQGSAAEAWTEEHIPWHLFYAEGRFANRPFAWLALGHLPADEAGTITGRLIQTAHRAGIPVSWTPGGTQIRYTADRFIDELRLLRLLVLNREEAIAFCQLPADTSGRDAALTLAARCGKQAIVVVTDGGKSPAVCHDSEHGCLYLVPPLPIQVVDPTGAGDAFHAGLVAGLIKGMDLEATLELARQKAAAICTVWGADGLGHGRNGAEPELLRPAAPIVAVEM
jgi:sugar/nucleoside kinase (ribokinase family)